LKRVFLQAKVALKNMLDNHCWDVSAFVACFDLPNKAVNYPSVLETTKLGLVSPKLPEGVEGNLVLVVSCRTVVNEAECVLRIKDKTDDNNIRYEGVGLRYWSSCRGRVKDCGGLDAHGRPKSQVMTS
jgi:hypothetical protein